MRPKQILFTSILLSLILLTVGCINNDDNNSSTENNNTEPTDTFYTLEEISEHNTKNDCWLLIDNKVYDVSTFITFHPGGDAILLCCGTDATELFKTRPMGSNTPHSENAITKRDTFYIGNLKR